MVHRPFRASLPLPLRSLVCLSVCVTDGGANQSTSQCVRWGPRGIGNVYTPMCHVHTRGREGHFFDVTSGRLEGWLVGWSGGCVLSKGIIRWMPGWGWGGVCLSVCLTSFPSILYTASKQAFQSMEWPSAAIARCRLPHNPTHPPTHPTHAIRVCDVMWVCLVGCQVLSGTWAPTILFQQNPDLTSDN